MTSTKWPPVFRAVIAVAGLAIAVATVLGACASTPSTGGPSNDGEPSAGQVTSSSNPGTGGSSAAAGPPGVSSSGQLTVPDSLTGRTFVSIGVSGHDLVAGSALTLTFDGTGTVSMNAGCNTMMGQATVGGAVLRIFQMTSTLIGCEPALMAQDTWVSRLFAKGLALDVHGDTLVLSSDEATITMRDRSAVLPNLPLAETTWRLEGVITGEGVTHFADETATMRIDGSRISYQACNTHSGVVAITADSATTSRMIGTDRACVGDRGEVENAMNSVLNGTFTIAIDGYRLTVTDTDGNGLMFIGIPANPTIVTPTSATMATAIPVSPSSSGSLASGSGGMSAPPRSTIGRHDSIPPQPTPNTAGGTN